MGDVNIRISNKIIPEERERERGRREEEEGRVEGRGEGEREAYIMYKNNQH